MSGGHGWATSPCGPKNALLTRKKWGAGGNYFQWLVQSTPESASLGAWCVAHREGLPPTNSTFSWAQEAWLTSPTRACPRRGPTFFPQATSFHAEHFPLGAWSAGTAAAKDPREPPEES